MEAVIAVGIRDNIISRLQRVVRLATPNDWCPELCNDCYHKQTMWAKATMPWRMVATHMLEAHLCQECGNVMDILLHSLYIVHHLDRILVLPYDKIGAHELQVLLLCWSNVATTDPTMQSLWRVMAEDPDTGWSVSLGRERQIHSTYLVQTHDLLESLGY